MLTAKTLSRASKITNYTQKLSKASEVATNSKKNLRRQIKQAIIAKIAEKSSIAENREQCEINIFM